MSNYSGKVPIIYSNRQAIVCLNKRWFFKTTATFLKTYQYFCDYTHFCASFKPITLPQKSYFEHEVGNEKWKILRFCCLSPHILAVRSKRRHTLAVSCR